jgi:hypothetical protein
MAFRWAPDVAFTYYPQIKGANATRKGSRLLCSYAARFGEVTLKTFGSAATDRMGKDELLQLAPDRCVLTNRDEWRTSLSMPEIVANELVSVTLAAEWS